MTVDQQGDPEALNGAFDFIERSYLSYILPKDSNLNLEEASEDAGDTKTLFDTIEQRQSLFFGLSLPPENVQNQVTDSFADETVPVHLILRTPLVAEGALRSCLSRLHISLEAQIVSEAASEKDSQQPSDTIFQGVVEDTDDPLIVVDAADDAEGEDEESLPHIYAVWKMPVFMARPRTRVQSPIMSFKASASLKPADAATALGEKAGYMRSGVPAGLNLLESFGADPALGDVVPRLSALRVSRVAPVTQSKHMMKPIRSQSSLRVKIHPAIHTRVRFSRPSTAPASAALIALLEIDFTPFFNCEVIIDSIALSVPESTIEDLNEQAGLMLPMHCWARDHVTFMYRLAPSQVPMMASMPNRDLNIAIEATIQADPGVCAPELSLSWTTTVDYTIPVNPGFGNATQPIQRSHRPSQLSIGGSETAQSFTAPAESRPDALPALEAATSRTVTETAVQDLGLVITFRAPSDPIYVGEPFSWSIFVVNRTSEKPSLGPEGPALSHRKLALVAIPKRRKIDARVLRPPSTAGKGKTAADGRQLADAVVDDNVAYAMQRNSAVEAADVVCLSADTRIGPLAPGACHVAELKFVALRAGIVDIDAVRVIDLGTQEHVDVRELPLIIADERQEFN